MSTYIKPGQVWAWQDTYDARGPHGSLFEIIEAGTDVTYRYRDAAGFDPKQTRAASAELIRANANLVRCVCRTGTEDTCDQHSATPAPLDPSKGEGFGTGDSVRWLGPDFPAAADLGVISGRTYTVRDHTILRDGVISLAGVSGMWRAKQFELVARATSHHPAPEPEPEWKPGAVGTATVRGVKGVKVMRLTASRVADLGYNWASASLADEQRLHLDKDVTDFVPDNPAEDVVHADLRVAQDELDDAYRTAAPDLDIDDRTEPLAVVVERLRKEAAIAKTSPKREDLARWIFSLVHGDVEKWEGHTPSTHDYYYSRAEDLTQMFMRGESR